MTTNTLLRTKIVCSESISIDQTLTKVGNRNGHFKYISHTFHWLQGTLKKPND